MTEREQVQIALDHHKAGRFAEAEATYRQILAVNPNEANALNLLGSLAAQLGRYDEALDLMNKAVTLGPSHAQFHANIGAVYQKLNRYEEAIKSLRTAVALNPNLPAAHQNIGNAWLSVSDLKNAEIAFQKAIALVPRWDAAHNDLGRVYRHLGKLNQAESQFKLACTINPNYAEANWNLSLLDLLRGNFESGWRGFEWRAKCPGVALRRELLEPRWSGEDIGGKTILLHAEQGFGDTFQFIRYAPLVAQRGAKVIVESQPDLVNVLKSVPGITEIIPFGEPHPPYDVHIPLMSLPLLFGTTLESIPANIPYITARPDRVSDWSIRLGATDRRRVGLAWFGRSTHADDRRRSILLELFAPFADIKSAEFVSLQTAPASSIPSGLNLHDFSAELRDFQDTAALIANLDLIISVDTSVAHLAGAMNKPVWLLLPFIPDWRWLLDRNDTPWYPSMKLYRQMSIGDWGRVIAKIADALEDL
jgi:Flp pilus assembly protein TadD